MLKVYETMLGVLRMLRPVIAQIEKHDKDLGNQLRRASSSVSLNMAEASGSADGTRRVRYRTALGSAREVGACLDVALAMGYVEAVDALLLGQLDHVRAVLAKVVR
ncbi:MAG TPA: four helix bundle protein [Polyangiaceae bacterium]|jgi:four helix bundle protein